MKRRTARSKQTDTLCPYTTLCRSEPNEPILVRVHSSCVTGDIFGSCRCDCGAQLHAAMEMIEKAGKGVIVYMNQEGRGIGLINKLRAYNLQENRSEEHTSELQSLMRISYAVFCLKKKKNY